MNVLRRWAIDHARGVHRLYRLFERVAPLLQPVTARLPTSAVEALVTPIERVTKQAMFNCKMCGQCGLSVTGMACPMGCAKEMRNGPCGGVRQNGNCEVHPDRRCTWVDATEGDERIKPGHTQQWWDSALPRDYRLRGKSTWVPMITSKLLGAPRTANAATPAMPVAPKFRAECSENRLEELSNSRTEFIVTVEIAPPDSADPRSLLRRAELFRGLVDAVNITDGAGANCHMSSAAASAILVRAGLNPVTQVSCRDRNRIALQGDVLGAAALGVQNVLCLTGDDVSQGDHPQAKPVFDLDAVNLLHTLRMMRDQGSYSSGRMLETRPKLFIGATANPFVPPFKERIGNLQRKIDAGAQFIQTQFCFDIDLLEQFMAEVRSRELHKRTAIIVGVGALSTAKGLRWMADHVPGVNIPLAVTERIAAADDQRAEGRRFCVEMIRRLRNLEGVAGVHLMGHKNEETLAQIIVDSGLRESAPIPN